MASIRFLLAFDEITQINCIADAVDFVVRHFVLKLVVLIIVLSRETSSHHSSQKRPIYNVHPVVLGRRQRPILAGVCKSASDIAVEKCNSCSEVNFVVLE